MARIILLSSIAFLILISIPSNSLAQKKIYRSGGGEVILSGADVRFNGAANSSAVNTNARFTLFFHTQQNLNIDVGSLLAGLGLGGLAFALAAKDTLANIFGSIVIFVDRPFQIGDWVVIGPIEGIDPKDLARARKCIIRYTHSALATKTGTTKFVRLRVKYDLLIVSLT